MIHSNTRATLPRVVSGHRGTWGVRGVGGASRAGGRLSSGITIAGAAIVAYDSLASSNRGCTVDVAAMQERGHCETLRNLASTSTGCARVVVKWV